MTTPRRRWLRFSLRTLFVVTTIAALLLGWLAYQLSWIRARNVARKRDGQDLYFIENHTIAPEYSDWKRDAPFSLRILGEPGVAFVGLMMAHQHASEELENAIGYSDVATFKSLLSSDDKIDAVFPEARQLKALFPEARIYVPKHADCSLILID